MYSTEHGEKKANTDSNGLYCSQTGFPEVLSRVVCGTKSIVAHKSARTEQQFCKKERPIITAEQEVCSVFLPSEFKPYEEAEEEEEEGGGGGRSSRHSRAAPRREKERRFIRIRVKKTGVKESPTSSQTQQHL